MSIKEFYILVLSGLPVTELRATIPLALAWGLEPWRSFVLAVCGNLVPVLPILLLLTPLEEVLARRFPRIEQVLQRLLRRTRGKGEQVKKYGAIGLCLFVAVPLPGTGAWTGAALAWLFGISVWSSFISIVIGVIIAGIIVTLVTLGVINVSLYYGLEFIAVAAVLLFVIYLCIKRWKKIK